LKKRRFLLFELLLAISLSAILFSVIFRVFSQTMLLENTIETVKTRLFPKQFCYFRLHDIFSKIPLSKSISEQDSRNENASFITPARLFTTSSQSLEKKTIALCFIFNNGIDPDPKFSGSVFAKISVNKQQQLILKIAPLKKSKPFIYRKEILLKNVAHQNFLFYFLETDNKTKKQSLKTSSCWEKTEKDLPIMFKMGLQSTLQTNPLFFAFFFPSETAFLEIP
jgi:hypothetical protein